LMLASMPARLSAQDAAGELEGHVAKALGLRKYDEAIELATKAVAAEPDQPASYALRATVYIAAGKSREAIADLDRLLAMNPAQPRLLEVRGTEKFKLHKFDEAIADFDQECKLDPARSPWHWKRGLAYYYAGQFAKGRDQFQAYHDRQDNDVENAVWRVMCMARMNGVGLKKAQAEILLVRRDPRVPMMEAYALFAGKAKPDDVKDAIKRGSPDELERNRRMFYGNLYLGLYHDMIGERERAVEHLKLAVKHPVEHFMWDIAKLHLAITTGKKE
jgi:lipoprotein NlpI